MSQNEKDTIKKALGEIIDPSSDQTLKDKDSVRHVGIESAEDGSKRVNLVIGLDSDDDKTKQKMQRAIAKVIKLDLKYQGLKIEFELNKKKDSILDDTKQVRYIGVASGKGGVGKSTVAANVAIALKRLGKNVGIIDADIYGSSIPTIMGMEVTAPRGDENENIIPFEAHGIQLISTEFFIKKDQPIMWRGPMLGKMLNHFFYDVKWNDDIEYVIVDLPPGTGDVAMDIQKLIPESQMLIVTTPHPSASHIAVKAGFAAKQLNHSLLGVVENMSYYNHAGETLKIFGEGGGKQVAEKLETNVIQQIPIGQPKSGHHSLFEMDEENGVIYLGLANKLLKEIHNQ